MDDRATLLVVDDEVGPRESFRMILKGSHDIILAASGDEALKIIRDRDDRIDMVLLDIRMPDKDGITVLQEIKGLNPDIEVAMVTAYASVETARNAIKYGAMDYLIKPFDRIDVEEMVDRGVARRRERRVSRSTLDRLRLANDSLLSEVNKARNAIQDHYANTVQALIGAIDAKDHYTAGHSERVADLTRRLAEACGLEGDELEMLCQAAKVHDIGKIGISETVLRKQGPLLREEMEEMKKHPRIGAEILAPVNFLKDVIPAVVSHHERYDGTGYHAGLAGDRISLYARIVAVADAIDAMGSDRQYRKALSPREVCRSLEEGAGTQFDPELVKISLQLGLPFLKH